MPTDPAGTEETASAPTVVAVVTTDDADLLEPCLDAVEAQLYPPTRVFVVGGDDRVRKLAGDREATWRPNLRGVYDSIGDDVTYVWFLRQRSRPQQDALVNLIRDGERVDASVAGSKILDAEDPEVLVSVGYATDVFDAPYSGLEPGELDQAQYDVIRDVAAIADASMLVRRDLFRGLRGVDLKMAPTSAAIDFCQRARLRGGRIVVVPSSVVHYQGPDPEPRWRERAGEIRAMIKAYSPITLLWALPVAMLIGLVEGILRPFVGRFPLPGVVAAWVWNLYRLPSALRARWQVRRGREAGDEELFRYQASGSVRLRSLYEDLLERVTRRFPEGILSGFSDAVEAGQQRVRHPAFFFGLAVVVFGLVATRDVWTDRLPVVGYSLPPPDSATATLGAYAGGWNPAGFGSPEVMRPYIGLTALAQGLLLGRAGLAVSVITVAAFIAGAFGTARMLRVWGVNSIPGYLAGMVLMAGPAVGFVAGESHWTAIPSMAALPWAVALSLRPWPDGLGRRAGRLAGAILAVGIGAAFTPLALVVPLAAVGLWALVGIGERFAGLVRILAATLLALPLLIPWLLYVDVARLVTEGSAFWNPGVALAGLVVVAVAAALLSTDRLVAALGVWGGIMTAAGLAAARSGGLGAGSEVEIGGALLAGCGVAVVAGSVFEMAYRRARSTGWAGVIGIAGVVAALTILASTLLVAGPGRAGLPRDEMTGAYSFAVPQSGSPTRMLLFGGGVPGSHRSIEGLAYRVIVPPFPRTWEARLNEPRLGDEALETALYEMLDGQVRRAGAVLAEFGIGWVAFTEPSPFRQVFDAQLDLVPLGSLGGAGVFLNEVGTSQALADGEIPWVGDGTGYRSPDGTAASVVVIASNADHRWGSGDWSQDGWRNRVEGQMVEVGFAGHVPRRLMALTAGLWLLALVAVAMRGQGRVS